MSELFDGVKLATAETDWLTAITDSDLDSQHLRTISNRWLGRSLKIRPWAMRGYHGQSGNDLEGYTGGVAYGEKLGDKDVSSILQAWGDVSIRVGNELLELHHFHVSRMDYAVTVLFSEKLPPVSAWDLGSNTLPSCKVVRIVPEGDEGGTLYVGSRGSDKFGRIYDKGAQLGTVPPKLYWRWEVEFKGQCARQAFSNYSECQDPGARRQLVASEVRAFFHDHEIPTPIIRDVSWDRPMIRYATRVRCSNTTIQWLQQQVQPALRNLQGAGRLGDALDALGILGGSLTPPESEMNRLNQWCQFDFLKELE